jgi:hypothetical protein
MQTQEHLQEHELGNLLRYWRRQRGKSQLDLSLDTGISQRHLSFVEIVDFRKRWLRFVWNRNMKSVFVKI